MPVTSADISGWSRQLSDVDVTVRREAARQLVRAGSAASPAVLALIQAVGDADEEVATQCSESLENLGPPSADDLTDMIVLLNHENSDCGYWVATLVGRLGVLGSPAVSELSSAVRSHAALAVRERAAWALGKIGPAAQGARETLEAASRCDSPRLARLAKESLERIGGSPE